MPGIVTARHLRDAIADSLVCGRASCYRLSLRGLRQPATAVLLRQVEADIFKEAHPRMFEAAFDYYKSYNDKPSLGGNNFVYEALLDLTALLDDKDVLLRLQDKDIRSSIQLAGEILDLKQPPGSMLDVVKRLPEDYGKILGRYVGFRSLIDKLISAYGRAGALRSYSQLVSKEENKYDTIRERLDANIASRISASPSFSPYSAIAFRHKDGFLSVNRISDVVLIENTLPRRGKRKPYLLTAIHFERLIDGLRRLSNCEMGVLLHYGMNDVEEGRRAVALVREHSYLSQKIGIVDSSLPGEAGKAGGDMYKAKISQTDELPYNNLSLLMNTYSEARAEAGLGFYATIRDSGVDRDTAVNLSFLWKNSLQPDSNIQEDFLDVASALKAPNKVKEDAALQLKGAFRRALLIGALREGRQPIVTPYDGEDLPGEIDVVLRSPTPNEADMRLITVGSMLKVRVNIPEVFPGVHDIEHLRFRDKSSTKEGDHVRSAVEGMGRLVAEMEEREDKDLLDKATLRADEFIARVRAEKGPLLIEKALQVTANDIVESLDDNISAIFRDAEKKFSSIVKSMRKIDRSLGDGELLGELIKWADDHPDLVINTAIEPKLGEVHKRVVRIFYMFERGMKLFLSQFERIARLADHYIKGAEIVKGDSAREKHMNILSSASRASGDGNLAYEILFDLSKFSQKFNHALIDAAGEVIGELVDYPLYGSISDLFKSSLLIVAARGCYATSPGVLGAFEGFLNFLWTGVHAIVMDIALKACGRSGDLAAYSDDGLLMFLITATEASPTAEIRGELVEVIESIKSTYSDFGLDFNLGKTILSRNLSEFLGQIMYRGKRMPTWIKELTKLGTRDENKTIYPLHQEVADISSQGAALVKAGLQPYAAWLLTYMEVMLGPGRRIKRIAMEVASRTRPKKVQKIARILTMAYFVLPGSWGGARTPDVLTSMMTADNSPLSEMVYELRRLEALYPESVGLLSFVRDSLEPTKDYVSLLAGHAGASTTRTNHGPGVIRRQVVKFLSSHFPEDKPHPLSRARCPLVHEAIESLHNIDLIWVNMIGSCCVDAIEEDRDTAPSRSSAVRKLLTPRQIRTVQSYDTTRTRDILRMWCEATEGDSVPKGFGADDIIRLSYPRLSVAPQLPSYRELASVGSAEDEYYEQTCVTHTRPAGHKGTARLLNSDYADEVAPPLITTDLSQTYFSGTADLRSHCTRQLYSTAIAAAAQGNDLLHLIDAMAEYNQSPILPLTILTPLGDLRKVAIANRKKALHRVYFGMSTKANMRMVRSGQLNSTLAQLPHLHYSLIITLAYCYTHYLVSTERSRVGAKYYYISFDPGLLPRLSLPRTSARQRGEAGYMAPRPLDRRRPVHYQGDTVHVSISKEAERAARSAVRDIYDRLLSGRMAMMADTRKLSGSPDKAEPLRSAIIWTLIRKISQVIVGRDHSAGIQAFTVSNEHYDAIPASIVDIAGVYACCMRHPKGALSDLAKGRTRLSPIGHGDADTVIDALRDLGLRFSLTRDFLMSREAAIQYCSILAADSVGLVYYGVEVTGEGYGVSKVSASRAKAIGRALESVITNLFRQEDYSPISDLDRLSLIILKDCIRSSVHRGEPYNVRVAVTWLGIFRLAITNLAERARRGWGDQSEVAQACEESLEQAMVIIRPVWGTVRDMGHGLKFLTKLAQWDALDNILYAINASYRGGLVAPRRGNAAPMIAPRHLRGAEAHQTYLYVNYILPAVRVVRTISYTSIEDSYTNLGVGTVDRGYDPLNAAIEDALAPLGDDANPLSLLHCERHVDFRRQDGWYARLEIEAMSRHGNEDMCSYLLAYSLALPLILTAGRPGVSSIHCLGRADEDDYGERVMQIVSDHSIPRSAIGVRTKLMLLVGQSEAEIFAALNASPNRTVDACFVVVEIPPDAGPWSIGLIAAMTMRSESYVVNGLSSDSRGTSLYVVSMQYPDVQHIAAPRPEDMDDFMHDFSYLSLASLDLRNQVNMVKMLSPLALTPLLQAGLGVSYLARIGNELIPMHTEEELLDRRKVSFIEMSRPTHEGQQLALLPPSVGACLIRTKKIMESRIPAFSRLILGPSYLLSLIKVDQTYEEIVHELIGVVQQGTVENAEILAAALSDLYIDSPNIDPSSMPVSSQMEEARMPQHQHEDIDVPGRVKRKFSSIAKHREREDNMVAFGNPLAGLFRVAQGYITSEDIIEAIEAYLDREDDEGGEHYGGDLPLDMGRRPVGEHDHRGIEFRPNLAPYRLNAQGGYLGRQEGVGDGANVGQNRQAPAAVHFQEVVPVRQLGAWADVGFDPGEALPGDPFAPQVPEVDQHRDWGGVAQDGGMFDFPPPLEPGVRFDLEPVRQMTPEEQQHEILEKIRGMVGIGTDEALELLPFILGHEAELLAMPEDDLPGWVAHHLELHARMREGGLRGGVV